MNDYIVVLSAWKRTKWLLEQLLLFKKQTIPPKEIWLCFGKNEQNNHVLNEEYLKYFDKIKILEDGGNVFSRFEMCYNEDDCYYFIIDDDMFPTKSYCESCLQFIKSNGETILASSGRIFSTNKYFPNTMLGSTRYSNSSEVDIGTNGWFLSREAIRCLIDNKINNGYNNGEDIALSFLNKSIRGISTFVIKQTHYINSDKYKHTRGTGEEALSHHSNNQQFYKERNEMLNKYRELSKKVSDGYYSFKKNKVLVFMKSLSPADHQAKSWKSGIFYENTLLEKISSMNLGGTYIDIGANVGNHSIALSLFSNADKIISFEPHIDIYKCYKNNISKNKISNIIAHNLGLSSENCFLKMCEINENNCGSTKIEENGTIEIEVKTLDSFEFTNISLIKIDVEGHELSVLEGSYETIRKNKPVLVTEASTKEEFDSIERFLAPFGYSTDRINYAVTPTYIWTINE